MPKKENLAKKPKILLVEDDTFLAGVYITRLELEGFQVLLAQDGETGLKLVEKEKPDLVLLDIILPQMDGFEVLKWIKGNAKTKSIPVILLTNLGERENLERGLALGAADYLIKAHFVPVEVVEKIKKIVK